MKATPFLERLADQIKSEIDKHLTDTAETGSSTEDDAIVMSVSFDLEAMVHRLGGLLQTAFDRNKLNHADSVMLATLCYHRVCNVPMDEAAEMARESVRE